MNGSGESTTGDTITTNGTVTIQGFPPGFNNTTVADGLGMLVAASGTAHTYNFHRVVASDEDVRTLGDQVNDFVNRYRTGNSNPTTDNDPGDLFYNTGNDTMFVRNGANNAWEQVQSIGNFFIIPDNELTDFANGSASVEQISNAPISPAQIILSINGVIQEPNTGTIASPPATGFALDGNTIVLSATPPNPSTVWGVIIGSTVNTGTPSDNTVDADILQTDAVTTIKIQNLAVTTGKLADDSVTAAKLKDSATTDADRAVTTDHIRDDSVTLAKLANLNANTIMGNNTASAANPTALTATQVRTLLSVAENANNYTHPNHGNGGGGDATSSGDGDITIRNNVVNEAKLAISNTPSNGEFLRCDVAGGNNTLTWAAAGGISDVVSDTTPQLGGNLDVNGQQIVSASNGDISIQPNGTGTVEVKRASSAVNTLANGNASVPVDLSLASNHSLTGNGTITGYTLANPTNAQAGQTGSIFIVQPASTDGNGNTFTLTPDTAWHFAKGGTHPTFTATLEAVDRIDYIVRSASPLSLHCVATFNYS